MAGHSHWAGIKHKKGKADKLRSKIFSKLSKEITVAAKLGDKDPTMNARLRSAIQAARSANMPKENIERAVDKSSIISGSNFENIRYEGFGPYKVAIIINALTDNKNRTASNIRKILQKSGGRLGENGSTSHYFFSCGILQINKEMISDEKIFEISTNCGAKDCLSNSKFHEIITERDDFYRIKTEIENKVGKFTYFGIEWRPKNSLIIPKDQSETIIKMLENLDEDEDVQNIYVNCTIQND